MVMVVNHAPNLTKHILYRSAIHSWLHNIADRDTNKKKKKKVGDHFKIKYWPESNPPQLYLLEEWNIQTSLDVFGKKTRLSAFKEQL
jgi:hypothetical protein